MASAGMHSATKGRMASAKVRNPLDQRLDCNISSPLFDGFSKVETTTTRGGSGVASECFLCGYLLDRVISTT